VSCQEVPTLSTTRNAGFTYSEDDQDTITIGFADKQYDTQEYVLLTRAKHVSHEEQLLDQHEIHITVDDELRSTYGGVESVEVQPGRFTLRLSSSCAKTLKVDQELIIKFRVSDEDYVRLLTRLSEMTSYKPISMKIRTA
jgi:hypothetical protein